MELVDEEGDLFGIVNVVDALVVLVLLAVVVAGATLVFGLGSQGEAVVRYATVDLGTQPDYVLERVEAGDRSTVESTGGENVTVTDVFATPPESGGEARLLARVEVEGTLVERDGDGVFEHGGERFRVGEDLPLETDDYRVDGTLTAVERSGPDLPTDRTQVVVESEVSRQTADEVRPGDEHRIGPHEVATVETVSIYPVGDDRRRIVAGVDLATIEQGGNPTFAGDSVTVGSSVSIGSGSYDLTGEVHRRGALEEVGEATTTRATLVVEGVDPVIAGGLREGMTETVRDETLANVVDVRNEPAAIVVESDDGNVHLRDHPRDRDVTMTVDLATRESAAGLRFHGRPIQIGDVVSLDLGSRTVQATVEDVE